MRQSAIGRRAGAAAAAFVALFWASAAGAAPGKLCSVTRGWVERHCDKAGRLATPERCTKWRGWLDDRCPTNKPDVSDTGANRSKAGDERTNRSKAAVYERVDRSKVRDDRDYDAARYSPPRHHKHAHKVRTRVVYVYVERPPRRCCYSDPVLYYRATPYKDQVFFTDYVLRPGKEAAFFRAYEANLR